MAATAAAIIAAWSRAENFGLYDDVLPCLRTLRSADVRMALVSNALGHGLAEVVAYFALDEFHRANPVQCRDRRRRNTPPRDVFGRCSRSAPRRDPVAVGR